MLNWWLLSYTHSLSASPFLSAQTGKCGKFYWGCQANRAASWPSAPPVPDCSQLRAHLLLYLWQCALGQKRRPHPWNRQRAMEPKFLSLLLSVAHYEFDQRCLCHHAVNGPESKRPTLQAKNGSTSSWKSWSGRRCGSSGGCFFVYAAGYSQISPRGRRRHAEERLWSLHSLRPAGDLPDQRRGGGFLWSDLLADWDPDSRSAPV